MTERRRAPRTAQQRARQAQQSLIPGSLAGAVANASPIIPGLSSQLAMTRSIGAQFGSGGSVLAWQDVFDLTAGGAQGKALTFLPLANSEHVYLNGLYQRETTEWTRSERLLNVLAAMDARTGDVLAVEYLYTSDMPAEIIPAEAATPGSGTANAGAIVLPAGTVAGDRIVAFVAIDDAKGPLTLNGWTLLGTSTAVSGLTALGTLTYKMHAVSKIVTGPNDTPQYDMTGFDSVWSAMRFPGGGALTTTAVSTAASGTVTASTPAVASGSTTVRCWVTLGQSTELGSPGSGLVRARANFRDLDVLLSTDPTLTAVPVTNSAAASWMLGTVGVT